ncbi:gp6 [Bacillus phage W.Ph.]|uniref:Gp6 n=1 Tax=Bacillus phage W.Ph. TaxID=764595 RepID=G9B1A7_9CAUD|nr:gp6 [Bacillus phage W.Ph.]ADH03152.1 gp6 [Bacillus phage W.Ph.]
MKDTLEEMFDSVQDYAETNLMVTLDDYKEDIATVFRLGARKHVDYEFYTDIKNDYKHVLTLVMTKMAVDYYNSPHFKGKEKDTVRNIFYKYNVDLESAFVREGLNYTTELLDRLLAEMVLELPFTYANALFKNEKVYEEYLENALPAYEPFILFLNAE